MGLRLIQGIQALVNAVVSQTECIQHFSMYPVLPVIHPIIILQPHLVVHALSENSLITAIRTQVLYRICLEMQNRVVSYKWGGDIP